MFTHLEDKNCTINKNIYLKINDNWHNKEKLPKIETVDIEILSDNDTIVSAFDVGALDVLTTNVCALSDTELTSSMYNIYETELNHFTYMGFNTNSSYFDTPEERQDVFNLIDKNKLCENIMLGHGVVANSPSREGVYYNEPPAEDEKEIDKIEGAEDAESDINKKDSEVKDYSAEGKSKKYDKDEKDEKDEEDEEGEEKNVVTLLYNSDNKTKERLASAIKHELEMGGYNVELRGFPYDEYITKMAGREYELYIGEVKIGNSGDISFMFSGAPQSHNICTYQSEELATMVSNINRMDTRNKKIIAWGNFEKFYRDKAFQLPLYFSKGGVMINKRISGKPEVNLTTFFGGFNELYLKN